MLLTEVFTGICLAFWCSFTRLVLNEGSGVNVNMAQRVTPVADNFHDRDEPEYLKFLEDSFLAIHRALGNNIYMAKITLFTPPPPPPPPLSF